MKKNGPWTIKGSDLKYRNPWIELREDQVVRPDGTEGVYGVVTQKPGISVLALDDDGFVYVVEEFRYALERNSLETVSGAIDEGEDSLDAAKRELKEETGITAHDWHSFGWLDPLSSTVRCPQHLYLARKLMFGIRKPDDNELIEVRKLKFTDVVQLVLDNKITYGPSCVLILKANEYLKVR